MARVLEDVVIRRVQEVLLDRIETEPVIALLGPRGVGKSTLLRTVAASLDVPVIDLDEPAIREAVTGSPSIVRQAPAPVCIDEFQRAPIVLDVLKARLNEGARAGTAILTGSTRQDALPRTAQALTGRLHLMAILPLSQGEVDGTRETFLHDLIHAPEELLESTPPSEATTRAEYVERIVAGGMPLALQRTGAARDRWFDDYVRQSVERDALDIQEIHNRDALALLLQRFAGQSAQVLNIAKLGDDLGIARTTIDGYARLLEDLFLIWRLPTWGRGAIQRTGAHPKVHLLDTGLAARLLHLSEARLGALEPAALTALGHLLETFVVNEIAKQASWSERPIRMGHWRTHDGYEVDLVLEDDDGAITAIGVKAGERASIDDARGLRRLRDVLGDRFRTGIVLTTGQYVLRLDDRIAAVPIDALWRDR